MRDFKGMKRQRGRTRKPGGGGNQNSTNPNRSWDSAGPEGIKVRGNAQTVYERYQQLARDAFSAGDRVLAENYLQHGEHYFRVLRALQPQRSVQDIAARETFSQGFDIDFEDESGAQAAAFAAAQAAQQQQQQAQDGGEDRDRPRNGDEREARGEGDDRPRDGRRDRWERHDRRPRQDRDNGDGGQGETRSESNGDPLAVIEPRGDAPRDETASAEPARERAPRRPRAERAAPRQAEGAAAALPGFLPRPAPARPAAEASSDEDAPRPARARTRRKASDAPVGEDAWAAHSIPVRGGPATGRAASTRRP